MSEQANKTARDSIIGAARGHLLGWCAYTDSTYRAPKHVTHLSDALMDLESGKNDRLVVCMPPRHGKTALATTKFPAWYLGKNPDHRVILAAHTADLAWTFSRQVRNEFSEYGEEVFGQRISQDSKAKQAWDIKGRKGGIVAAGVGGPLTGRGADLLCIDDPVKDEVAASSPTTRERIWNWYRQVARTRLHPGGKIVVIMTRWNELDLVGKILAEGGDGWRVISLPALAEDNDELGRSPGEALWPTRYSETELKSIRRDIGSYAFASLYQQRPSPPEGALVKKSHLRYYLELPDDFDSVIQVWDCAVEAKDTSSFVVGQVWGRKGPHRYLLDQFRSRVDILGTMVAIKNMRKKWPRARSTYIEKKANGAPVIQILNKQLDSLIAFDPKGSKEQRLNACLPLFEGGNIYLPDSSIAPWVNDLVYELVTFPHGVNDDQVDCLSMAQDRFNVGYNIADMSLRLHVGEQSPYFTG